MKAVILADSLGSHLSEETDVKPKLMVEWVTLNTQNQIKEYIQTAKQKNIEWVRET